MQAQPFSIFAINIHTGGVFTEIHVNYLMLVMACMLLAYTGYPSLIFSPEKFVKEHVYSTASQVCIHSSQSTC